MPTIHQKLAVGEELRDAVRLIRCGFGQLQQLDGANDFYHLPLLALSSGFERFMKVILCFRHLQEHGEFPTGDELPTGREGHNLRVLLDRVRKTCFCAEYIARIPVAQWDLEYSSSDILLSFLGVLSDFGSAARYHNLDIVLGRTPKTQPPEQQWERLETDILLARPHLLECLKEKPGTDTVFKEIASEVVLRLERLARALARLFTIGGIGDEARRYTGLVQGFLCLRDEDLGHTKYSPFGAAV